VHVEPEPDPGASQECLGVLEVVRNLLRWCEQNTLRAPRVCFSNEGCPGWQVCSVSLGDCGSLGSAGWLAMAARSQVSVAAADGAHADASIGVEVVPTWLGAYLSFAADRDGGWRLRAALDVPQRCGARPARRRCRAARRLGERGRGSLRVGRRPVGAIASRSWLRLA
jgi:hypothetical protein